MLKNKSSFEDFSFDDTIVYMFDSLYIQLYSCIQYTILVTCILRMNSFNNTNFSDKLLGFNLNVVN
jgi:hypothetical protein